MNQSRWVLVAGLAVPLLGSLCAQEQMKMPGGLQGTFLKLQKGIEKEAVTLAQAVPQDKYTWIPMEGVRSISEAFMHLAFGNYLVMQTVGVKLPKGIDLKTFQTSTTDRTKVVDALKASLAFIDEQIGKVQDSDFDHEVNFFGSKMTIRDMIVIAGNHEHEILDQAIA